jgi:hypothetical protein
VTLYFQEIFFWYANQRIFDVAVEGTMAYANLDLVGVAGYNVPFSFTVTATDVDGDGLLTIELVGQLDAAKISGLEVRNHDPLAPVAAPVAPPVAAPVEPPTGPELPIFINAGGPTFTDQGDITWLADNYYNGGLTTDNCGDTPGLYCSERWGNHLYQIPVPAGNFDVTLYFQEIFFWYANQRAFDVIVEGTLVLANLDLVYEVGYNVPYTFALTTTDIDGDGFLTVEMVSQTDNAKISGIEVRTAVSA